MCRLYGFRATEPTKVECSLVLAQNALLHQSESDLRGVAHPDGWGIAYYEDGVPTVERRATAAFEDLHFSRTAERTFARTVVAHVRQATVGPTVLDNTHPFAYGKWTFAHNGSVRGFAEVGPRLEAETDPDLLAARRGETDSEAVFLWLLSRLLDEGLALEAAPGAPPASAATLADILGWGLRVLDRRSREAAPEEEPKLNFILTDGDLFAATRWNHTLHWVEREGTHDCEMCGIPHEGAGPGSGYRAVAVASEPITGEPWRELPEGAVLTLDREVRPEVHPPAG